MSRQIVNPETGETKFDARTHIRDNKGRIVDVRPYLLIMEGQSQYFVDKKTGKKYTPGGDEILPEGVQEAATVAPKAAQPTSVRPIPKAADKPVQPDKRGFFGRQKETVVQAAQEPPPSETQSDNPEPPIEYPKQPEPDGSL